MSLGAALVLLIFLITLVILLLRLFAPLRAGSTLFRGGERSVKDSPEWKALSETRDEIEKDPLLDEQSRTSLINSWRSLADQSKRILESEDSTAGPGFAMKILSNRTLLIPLFILSSFAFLWGLEGFTFRSPELAGLHSERSRSGPTVDQAVTRAEGHPGDGSSLESRAEALMARLVNNPNDADGWFLLSRTQAALSQYPEAAASLKKALEIVPGHPGLLADLADMLAMANDRKMTGEPEAIVAQALVNDPNHEKSLALAATAREQAGDQAGANQFWQRLSAVQQERLAAQAAASAAQSDQKPAPSQAGWARVEVSVGKEILAGASPQAVLFVFAKEQPEAGMPLAAKRIPLANVRPGVNAMTLTDSDWIRGKPDGSTVYLQARLAMSGSVAPSEDDRVSEWLQIQLSDAQAQAGLVLQ